MDEHIRTDENMEVLQMLSMDYSIDPDMIRLLKEKSSRDYEDIKNIIVFCEEKNYNKKMDNRWTKGKEITNLPSMLLCDD